MTRQIPYSESRSGKTMNPEQLNQIIEAILSGKYSWACVLLLRFAGYNPLHYIPYRTYNRLLKENNQATGTSRQSAATRSSPSASQKRSSQIADLGYLEPVGQAERQVKGSGIGQYWQRAISRIPFPSLK